MVCRRAALLLGSLWFAVGGFAAQTTPVPQGSTAGETIVLVRHGEKPPNGLGQLTCRGLNRALALPEVLTARFGRPAAIFAPDPADQIHDNKPGLPPSPLYSYVRPLATIEPTAIEAGLPVDTQLAFGDIAGLQKAVTAPEYAHATVFIAWEHYWAEQFAKAMLTAYGLDPKQVPEWLNSDYETMYVFQITPAPTGNGPGTLRFQIQQEGLDGKLSDTCPGS